MELNLLWNAQVGGSEPAFVRHGRRCTLAKNRISDALPQEIGAARGHELVTALNEHLDSPCPPIAADDRAGF